MEYVICFVFGSGAVLFSGILGTLLSGLLILGLGDVIWRFIPFAYGIRLVTGAFTRRTENYFSSIPAVIVISILLFLLFFITCRLWQGKQKSD